MVVDGGAAECEGEFLELVRVQGLAADEGGGGEGFEHARCGEGC